VSFCPEVWHLRKIKREGICPSPSQYRGQLKDLKKQEYSEKRVGKGCRWGVRQWIQVSISLWFQKREKKVQMQFKEESHYFDPEGVGSISCLVASGGGCQSDEHVKKNSPTHSPFEQPTPHGSLQAGSEPSMDPTYYYNLSSSFRPFRHSKAAKKKRWRQTARTWVFFFFFFFFFPQRFCRC